MHHVLLLFWRYRFTDPLMAPELPPTLLGDNSQNANIICLMTKTGGHVGWAQVHTYINLLYRLTQSIVVTVVYSKVCEVSVKRAMFVQLLCYLFRLQRIMPVSIFVLTISSLSMRYRASTHH
jgi:hypothetical protein